MGDLPGVQTVLILISLCFLAGQPGDEFVSRTIAEDIQDLAAFGYKPVLDRTLGSFSSFAAGFSYISILTGVFQMFYVGYGAGGPAFYWTWPVVFLGQLAVALCFAELAARYPLSGGIYQWSRWIGSRGLGWMAGWVYLSCSIISLAAVALALQATLPQIAPIFQMIGDPTVRSDSAKNAVLLGCVLIALTTVINSVGVRLLARINNIGVIAELIGVALLIVLLAVKIRRGPAILFEFRGHVDGSALSYLSPFLAATLMASYVLYGFDTAGSLAEETDDPRRRAPWAILQALAAAAMAGGALDALWDPGRQRPRSARARPDPWRAAFSRQGRARGQSRDFASGRGCLRRVRLCSGRPRRIRATDVRHGARQRPAVRTRPFPRHDEHADPDPAGGCDRGTGRDDLGREYQPAHRDRDPLLASPSFGPIWRIFW